MATENSTTNSHSGYGDLNKKAVQDRVDSILDDACVTTDLVRLLRRMRNEMADNDALTDELHAFVGPLSQDILIQAIDRITGLMVDDLSRFATYLQEGKA